MKLFSITLLAFSILGFSSCQKEYTCSCKRGAAVVSSENMRGMLGDVRKDCDKGDEASETGPSMECEIQ